MFKHSKRPSFDGSTDFGYRPVDGAHTLANVLTVDFSGNLEGVGITTQNFTADINGGFDGTYFIDSGHFVTFMNVDTFKVTGTNYADTIQVGDGSDTVNAGGGNDLVILGFGKDKADGGDGIDGYSKSFADLNAGVTVNLLTDTISVAGSTVKNFEYFYNVVGTSFNDTFISSDKRGDDTVNGGEGDDFASFQIGFDQFTGGAGNDTLGANFSNYTGAAGIQTQLILEDSGEGYHGYYFVDNGNRTYFGTTENFQVTGTKNNDSIAAGTGNDVVNAGAGNDVVTTSSGTDMLDGGAGTDGVGRDFSLLNANITVNLATGTVTGVSDTITNFEYFYAMQGGFGNDTFLGTTAQANDNVNGGAGNDTASFYAGTDIFTGGAGNDRAIVDYSLVDTGAGIQTNLQADTDGGYKGYFYVDQPHRTDFTSVEAFTITGTAYNDGIQTGDGADTVSAGAGNDLVQTGAGVDTLDGGDGIDGVGRNLSGLNINVAIDLAAGTATSAIGSIVNFEYFAGYSGSQKADTLVSTHAQANDSVTGGGGNDTLTVFNGTDTFAGGIGTDRLIVDYSLVDVGVGIQTNLNADSNGGFQGYYYVDQPHRIDFTSVEAFTITGTNYNDSIVTRTGDDTISGGGGDDVIDTGSGADVNDGGAGFDGIGRDLSTLIGANITFNLTNDKLLGAAGSSMKNFEYLYNVTTSTGNDTFVTLHNSGNDNVSSGGGNDVMSIYGGYDHFNAGTGTDTLNVDYSGLDTDAGMQVSIGVDSTNGGFQGYFYIDGGNRTDYTGTDVFNIIATNNNDSIAGGSNADTLTGLDGRDTLTGNGGNDVLDGGAAADTLNGGQGKDTLIAGSGADTLTGGTEADTFVFKSSDFPGPIDPLYLDRITDFSGSTGDKDKIDLSGIDANTGMAGDQAFTFIGSGAFTAAGQVHVVVGAGGFTYLEGNWNADLAADFSIRVDGTSPAAADIVL